MPPCLLRRVTFAPAPIASGDDDSSIGRTATRPEREPQKNTLPHVRAVRARMLGTCKHVLPRGRLGWRSYPSAPVQHLDGSLFALKPPFSACAASSFDESLFDLGLQSPHAMFPPPAQPAHPIGT